MCIYFKMLARRAFSSCSFANFQAVITAEKFMRQRKKTFWYMKKNPVSKEMYQKYKSVLESSSKLQQDNKNVAEPSTTSSESNNKVISLLSVHSKQENNVSSHKQLPDLDEKTLYICKLYDCGFKTACRILQRSDKISKMSIDELKQIVSDLEKLNVDLSRIKHHEWLLLTPLELIENKAKKIAADLDLDFEVAVSFVKGLKKPWRDQIKIFWNEEKKKEEEFTRSESLYRNRIDYMAHRLECKPWIISDMMAYAPGIAELPFDRLKYILKLLLDDALIHPKEIVRKPSILLDDVKMIEERIKILHQHNVKHITPPMLRQPDSQFNFFISEVSKRLSVTDSHSSLLKFIQEKLQCNDTRARIIVAEFTALRRLDHSELERKIKSLLAKGLNLGEINGIAGILCEDESEIEKIYAGLKAINIPEEDLKYLYLIVLRRKYCTSKMVAMYEEFSEDDDY